MEIKNRSAYFEYYVDDKFTAGIMLLGTEVKSLRAGRASRSAIGIVDELVLPMCLMIEWAGRPERRAMASMMR